MTDTRTSAVVLGLALTVSVAVWLLAQSTLSMSAGAGIADLAAAGARVLALGHLLVIGLAAPWLSSVSPGRRALGPFAVLVLIPLPLQTLVVLAGPTDAGTAALATASVLGAGVLLLLLTAAIRRIRMAGLAAFGCALVQAGAAVLTFRFGSLWLDTIGMP